MVAKDSPKAHAPQDQPVSQDEVERLLAQVAVSDPPDDPSASPATSSLTGAALLEPHSFPPLSFFSPSELRKLRVRHEEFIHSVAARLAAFLRLEIALQMSKLETLSYENFTQGLSNPTHLTFARMEPLPGTCLVEIPPRLALTLIDRELGGPGVYLEEARELSQVETRLLSHILDMIVNEWCNAWSDLLELRPVLSGYESSGQYLQTSPPRHTLLVVGVEVRIGELVEPMQLAFPYQTLEALLLKLSAGPGAPPTSPTARPIAALRWSPKMANLKMRVSVKATGLELNAGKLAALRPGDILPLPEGFFNQLQICLENNPKFIGSLGSQGERRAFRIDQVVPPDAEYPERK